jgi:hypothetical protein
MRSKFLFATILPAAFSLFIVTLSLTNVSCGGNDKKKDEGKPNTETVGPSKGTDDGMVPKIDTASLKDEASILDAMQKVVDARIADEKKRKEDPNYAGHFVELMTLHTIVLKASTAYSRSLNDPSISIEFGKKFNAIEDKLYPIK